MGESGVARSSSTVGAGFRRAQPCGRVSARGSKRFGVTSALIAAMVVLAFVTGACTVTPPSRPGELPVPYGILSALPGTLDPGSPPPGANDFGCRSRAHPRPVVLVHGTFANQSNNWASLSPLLKNNGYCVFTFNYGAPALGGFAYGMGPIERSAAELAVFVDQVMLRTGAEQVDLVGHSQGGMMPRYYLNFLGGGRRVHHLVALAPSSHGTTFLGLVDLSRFFGISGLVDRLLAGFCVSCVQQEAGSDFVKKMASVPDTVPGVHYTVIASRYDEIVTPYESQFLSGPNVRNITIQDVCALDNDGHAGLAWDHIALNEVLNALDPGRSVSVPCTFIPFDFGG